MSRNERPPRPRLPKGVAALPVARGGRAYRATVRTGKGVEVHLGLYETPWLAAFAYGVAARALGRDATPVQPPRGEQPGAERVREITARVLRRLGLDRGTPPSREAPPATDDLLTLFEVAVVGFWRGQAAGDSGGHPDAGLDAAAGRLAEAAGLLFWSRAAGHPDPLAAMTRLLARRLDAAFRRADLTREVLDDDGDDPRRVARWLVHPDAADLAGGRVRGFREEVRALYADLFQGSSGGDGDGDGTEPGASRTAPAWADVLGVSPPFDPAQVRAAYRAKSRDAHPDAGGTDADFVRLRTAYEEARAYFAARGR